MDSGGRVRSQLFQTFLCLPVSGCPQLLLTFKGQVIIYLTVTSEREPQERSWKGRVWRNSGSPQSKEWEHLEPERLEEWIPLYIPAPSSMDWPQRFGWSGFGSSLGQRLFPHHLHVALFQLVMGTRGSLY